MTAQPRPQTPGALAPRTEMDAPRPGRDDSAVILAWVHGVLSETDQAPEADITGLRVLRDGRKRLAVVGLVDGRALVLKQYADERGAWTQRWLDRLTDAGFAPPRRLSVTPARGWSRTHRTLVTDLAPERPWTSWLTASPADRDAAAQAAADWLVALQATELTLPDRSLYRAGDELQRHGDELAVAFPTHATSLRAVSRAAHGQLYATGGTAAALVPSHGDLHPNNLHVAEDRLMSVMAIDVDTAGLRRAAYDVGYALAQLLIVSWMRTGSFHDGAAAGKAFWRRWLGGGGSDADAVAAEAVRTLLQSLHFELITYANGRTDLLDRWLGVAHSLLTAGLPETLNALATTEENAS